MTELLQLSSEEICDIIGIPETVLKLENFGIIENGQSLEFQYRSQRILDISNEGQVSLLNQRITNVANPVDDQDVVTKAYGDANYMNSGTSFSGRLSDLSIDVVKDWEEQRITNVGDPVNAQKHEIK